jgi:predicted alpha/beta superfamily hydrolase
MSQSPVELIGEPIMLPGAEAFDVTSPAGEPFRISVGLPPSYSDSSSRYPVLYVLDGDICFGTLLETCRLRGRASEIDEVIVVGIGYPLGTDAAVRSARRLYDFSVADWDRDTPAARHLDEVITARGQVLRFGGAGDLLDLLTERVQPLVNARYRSDPGDQALFGHSAGGNFVGHCLFRRTGAFSKYIAGSPAFTFNDWDVFRLEESYAQTHDDLPVTMYLAAASDEARQMAISAIVSGTARMAETLELRKYPGLKLTCEFIPGRSHGSVFTDIMQRGLEVCWPGVPHGMANQSGARANGAPSRRG